VKNENQLIKGFLSLWLILSPAGCLLAQTAGRQSQSIGYEDVKEILISKCAVCHRPGEAAPFALLTYEDVAKRASFIKKVISSNYMPPWRADTHYREFANDRRLTDSEKGLLLRWIDAGVPKGAEGKGAGEKELRDTEKGGEGQGTRKGGGGGKKEDRPVAERQRLLSQTAFNRPPDLKLRIDSPFLVPGDNAEQFVVFKLPYEIPEGENVEAIEFYCDNKKVIHHINYGFYDVPDTSLQIFKGSKFIDGDLPGYAIKEYDPFKKNFVYYTGWVPGASIESYPAGFGWPLPRRGVILLTAHFAAQGADERPILGVNLFFSKKPVQRSIRIIAMGSGGIGEKAIDPPLMIRAGHVDTFTLKVRTKKDQTLLYIWPHMHYIGKEFTAFAVTPAGDTIPLVHIPNWDFRWQEMYRLKHLVRIPAGSDVNIVGVYDNTADNPANPNSPPRMIFSTGNMISTQEMLTLVLIYVNSEEGDEKVGL
jgi:hypothetical protein